MRVDVTQRLASEVPQERAVGAVARRWDGVDFDLSEEQLAFAESVRRFARRDLSGDALALTSGFPAEAWRRCAAFGIQGLAVPERYGGSGADVVTTIAGLEALGYTCSDNGLIFSLNAQMWACQEPIRRFGSDEQRQRWLPALCDGSLVAGHATTEPDAGSDAFALRTTARREGDGYVLSGSKTFVTNGPVADLFLVLAATDPGRELGGLTAFVVEREAAGLTVGPPVDTMGLESSPMSDLFLDDCYVPAAHRLGREGRGGQVFTEAMERERSLILASAVGTMARNLERSLGHARERRQFGEPIGKFQAVSHRLVDMKLRLETARLLLYRLGWLMDQERDVALESALTKLHLSEALLESSLDALQIHGGYGYTVECGIERDVRDAVGGRLYSGTSEMQRNLVARRLGL